MTFANDRQSSLTIGKVRYQPAILGETFGVTEDAQIELPRRIPIFESPSCQSPLLSGVAAGIYCCLTVGYGSCRTTVPVSSRDFKLQMIFGHPPETATMRFEGSRSMV
jgi:hypothetical protein